MVTDIVGRFAHITSNQYTQYGLEPGELVFIAGSGFSPVDEDDNYKLLFIVTKMNGDIPSKDNGVTISRKNLELLSDPENERYFRRMEESLAEREEEKDTTG